MINPDLRESVLKRDGYPAHLLHPDHKTARIKRTLVCSNCWGELKVEPSREPHVDLISCFNCGMETRGYVSREWARQRKLESGLELNEVKRNYPELAPDGDNEKANEASAEELIHEIGF